MTTSGRVSCCKCGAIMELLMIDRRDRKILFLVKLEMWRIKSGSVFGVRVKIPQIKYLDTND